MTDESQSALERPLPQNPDAERAVLGALLAENTDAGFVLDLLRPDDFFLFPHQVLFSALREIREVGGECDLLLLEERLRLEQKLEAVGGINCIGQLVDGTSKALNVKLDAQIVREKAILRVLIQMTERVAARALHCDSENGE